MYTSLSILLGSVTSELSGWKAAESGGGGLRLLFQHLLADLWVQGQPGLQSEFKESQGYTVKPYLKKQKQK